MSRTEDPASGTEASHVDRAAGRRLGRGVSGLYLSLYVHYGFFAFMPLWLKGIGVSPQEISMLLTIPLILRLLTVAPFASFVGRRGWVRNAIVGASLASAAIVVLLLGEPALAGRIAIFIGFSIVWDQLPVLTDGYAVMAVRSRSLDLGRLRVWGSIAVVISNAAAGWTIDAVGIELLPLMIAGLLITPVVVAFLLPADRELAAEEEASAGNWRDLVSDRGLILAMIAAALTLGSHGVLNTFAAIQWNGQGISATTIGFLQAFAVAAEIGAFWFGAKLLGARDPRLLICAGAVTSVLRWSIMATSPALPLLIFAQMLNGITATGTILGIMLVIAMRVPTHLSASAQGMYYVFHGAVLAVSTAGSGLLWSYGFGVAYVAMAALALLGVICAWPRRRRPGGIREASVLSASGGNLP